MINSSALKEESIEVSIIIVSYNTADWIRICLESVALDRACRKEVFVIDNASTDGSVDLIRRDYPWVDLTANEENRGFAAANNQVLARCRGNFIFFLNPDTEVTPGSLGKLIAFMEANPAVGLAGSKMVYPDGKLQESVSYRYPGQSYTTSELSGLKGSIAWVLGACMIARTEILMKMGGFDEDFFLYGEEQDLCLRIRRAGYEIGYCPGAVVVHRGGHSERNSSSLELWTKRTQAEYLFYKKHYLRPNIERILRRELIKACWRIATLNLSLPFVKNRERVKEKLAKYRVIYRESRWFRYENHLPKSLRERRFRTGGAAMERTPYLNQLIQSGAFRFEKLILPGIDNAPILQVNALGMAGEEVCLFHKTIAKGNQYLEILHKRIMEGFTGRKELPVVRFADGEYAFYQYSLKCNGLYQQAESVEAMRKAMPGHIEALHRLAKSGILAPLIFPGNTPKEKGKPFSFWRRSNAGSSPTAFVDFLFSHDIRFDQNNYIPFYVVYAYLTSEQFARVVDNKKVCLIASEYRRDSCGQWFARFHSHPTLIFVDLPDSYVATRWSSLKENVLRRVPRESELCLVGAGIGALPVCVDVAREFSIPAIDAGHVLNMMNGREEKSKGPRLYTLWKNR